MNKQPEALRLAAHAEANAFFGDMKLIAAELRCLHEVNTELLAALKQAAFFTEYAASGMTHSGWVTANAVKANAVVVTAIAKAEGEKP